MGNCLVTKLKSVVDNDNLEKLGVLHCNLHMETENGTVYIYINGHTNKSVTVHSLSSINFIAVDGEGEDRSELVDAKTVKLPGTGASQRITTDAPANTLKIEVEIENYYDLERLYLDTGISVNTEKFKYINYVKSIRSVSVFAGTLGFNGDIKNFAYCPDITTLRLPYVKDIYGNIQDIGSLINLNRIELAGCHNVIGTLESFVAKQRGAGRLTATNLNFGYTSFGTVTFNSIAITSQNFPASGDAFTLSWTADTITLNSVTIDNSDVEN